MVRARVEGRARTSTRYVVELAHCRFSAPYRFNWHAACPIHGIHSCIMASAKDFLADLQLYADDVECVLICCRCGVCPLSHWFPGHLHLRDKHYVQKELRDGLIRHLKHIHPEPEKQQERDRYAGNNTDDVG